MGRRGPAVLSPDPANVHDTLEWPRPRDARRIAKIEAAAWREAYRHLLTPGALRHLGTEERVFSWMNRIRFGEGRHVGIVRQQGLIAGYVTYGPARFRDLEPGFAGEVYELYVHPDLQGRGHGRALLRGAFDALRAAGLLWGVVEVLRDNQPARRFYGALGLQTDGRIRRRASVAESARGSRYSVPRTAVAVVRYERPLVDLSW